MIKSLDHNRVPQMVEPEECHGIQIGDVVRFATWEEHPYGSMLRPLLEQEGGRRFVVVGEDVIPELSRGRSLVLERLNDTTTPFKPGQANHTIWEGWLKKDEFLSAVARARRLGPDVAEADTEA